MLLPRESWGCLEALCDTGVRADGPSWEQQYSHPVPSPDLLSGTWSLRAHQAVPAWDQRSSAESCSNDLLGCCLQPSSELRPSSTSSGTAACPTRRNAVAARAGSSLHTSAAPCSMIGIGYEGTGERSSHPHQLKHRCSCSCAPPAPGAKSDISGRDATALLISPT